jgi:hypothetical protein
LVEVDEIVILVMYDYIFSLSCLINHEYISFSLLGDGVHVSGGAVVGEEKERGSIKPNRSSKLDKVDMSDPDLGSRGDVEPARGRELFQIAQSHQRDQAARRTRCLTG